jgi:hypothetical protein
MNVIRRCRRASFVALLGALVTSGVAFADQGGASAPAQARPAAELAHTTVKALTLAESIEQLLDRIDRNRLGEQSSRFDAMSSARSALSRAQEGAALFGRPMGAPGDPIRRSSTALRNAFNTLSSQLNEAIRLWDKLASITSISEESETSDVVRALATILSDERAWQGLTQGTRDVTNALTEKERLLLTRAERDAVVASLKGAFPRLGTNSRGGTNTYAAASVLHDFLTRPVPAADE